jgi:ABC-type phosphate transport system permease subunit
MADALTSISNFINSPPGQLVAGTACASFVWKAFVWFEADLTEMTKFEIAVWLVGRQKFGPKVESWPRTFAKVFDSFFGTRHISLQCFGLSVLMSVVTGIFLTIYAPSGPSQRVR